MFHDFFMVGLDFPIEGFVSEVLERFRIQLHQLTPNAFVWLGMFAMAMKMLGSQLLVDRFIHFYETQHRRTKVNDPDTEKELPSEFGAFNFVHKKTRGTISIVSTDRISGLAGPSFSFTTGSAQILKSLWHRRMGETVLRLWFLCCWSAPAIACGPFCHHELKRC